MGVPQEIAFPNLFPMKEETQMRIVALFATFTTIVAAVAVIYFSKEAVRCYRDPHLHDLWRTPFSFALIDACFLVIFWMLL